MAEQGKLVWQTTKAGRVRRVVWTTKKGALTQPTQFPDQQLDQALAQSLEDEVEVDLDLEGGQPTRIRPRGEGWTGPAGGQTARGSDRGAGQPHRGSAPGRQFNAGLQQHRPAQPAQPRRGDFHNPYNFVPALPRASVTGDLGDGPVTPHGVFAAARFSGTLTVEMTLQTPLLLPDAARCQVDQRGHKTYPVRVDSLGRPSIPPTSVKGMLRSGYEAITNSRLGVFEAHDARLAFRMAATDGLRMVPARIETAGTTTEVVLLTGSSAMANDGRPNGNSPMYAAWLKCYPSPGWLGLDRHEAEVWAFITPWQHQRFSFWNVAAMLPGSGPAPSTTPGETRGQWRQGDVRPSGGAGRWVKGWVCVTNQNMDRKHDERVFFSDAPRTSVPLTKEMRDQWKVLITDYQKIHQEEIKKKQSGPPACRNARWSRHVVGGTSERELKHGTLCYALVRKNGAQYDIESLYPVMIARQLHRLPPRNLLPQELHPATDPERLSPADRVFGWVNQSGRGACRGSVRVGPIHCDTADAVQAFDDGGLPLAILGQPKPAQSRFYVARDVSGAPQQDGTPKASTGYDSGKGLRGRKVYPHQESLQSQSDYWNPRGGGRRREYLRGQDVRDDQNRSVLGWVKPQSVFRFDLHVENLSEVELGGLLWLLEQDGFHRLGGGKPLGFGSVRLALRDIDLRNGAAWRSYYSAFDNETAAMSDIEGYAARSLTSGAACTSLVQAYKDEVARAYGKPFDQVSFIAAWRRAMRGWEDGLPVHYPRRASYVAGPAPPDAEGKSFEWFVQNERTGRDQGPHCALPALDNDHGLPYL